MSYTGMPKIRSTMTALMASDICALLASFFLAYLARLVTGGSLVLDHYIGLLPFFALFICLYAAMGLYPGVVLPPQDELKRLSIGTTTGFLFVSSFFFVAQQGIVYSRFVMLLSWAFALLLIPLFRFAARRKFAGRAWWGYPVLLLTVPGKSDLALNSFMEHQERGLYIAKTVPLKDETAPGEDAVSLHNKLRAEAVLCGLANEHPGAIAFILVDSLSSEEQHELIMLVSRHFRRIIVQMEASWWTRQTTLQVAELPCGLALSLRQNLLDPNRMRMKRFLDLLLCLLGSVVLIPLIPVLALCIRLDSAGPVFFSQWRIGQNGRPIRVYKFRTMVVDAENTLKEMLAKDPALRAEWARDQKLSRDPRLTGMGRFLRHTSLDELPQIWNVLKNEMSLVGPRPIVDEETERYGESYELYKRVKPGLTGLWQVSGRNDIDYANRVELDKYYIYNWSVWLDIYILFKTLPAIFTGKGAC